jgi:hypothetical protein
MQDTLPLPLKDFTLEAVYRSYTTMEPSTNPTASRLVACQCAQHHTGQHAHTHVPAQALTR